MRKSIAIIAALMGTVTACGESRAGLIPVAASDFAPGDSVLGFETGTSNLPVVPGVSFLNTAISHTSTWYNGVSGFDSFGPSFGNQDWVNEYSGTYSALGFDLTTPVEAIGGYVAKIPNFKNTSPSSVTIDFVDSSDNSLGTATVTLSAANDSPVFFGFTSNAPIAGLRVIGDGTGGGGFFGVDNVVYGNLNNATAPEPATLISAALAIPALVLLRRRYRGRTAA